MKLTHNQLLKNEAALKTFQDKYGLTRETIEKYLIGYQNEHYVIPMEVAPGEWIVKEHKGNQTKGAKASLYPPDIIREGMPYVIVTEGEFKALILNQKGFPAVSGTAGAGTWKKEWTGLFSNLNVIIAYDHDSAGQDGTTTVVNNLKGVAKSVKTIAWPSFMEFDVKGSDKKDVTDFFVTLKKTKEDFQGLLNNAKEVVYAIQEIDGIRFVQPEDFVVKETRVEYKRYLKDSFDYKPAFYAPLFITGRAIDVDSGFEDVEVAFKWDHKWKRIWITKLLISDAKKIIELANHGLPVNSRNSGRMIEYLAAFEAFNINLIPKTFVSKGFGFKLVENKRVFILEKMVGKKATQDGKEISVEFSPEPGFERFVLRTWAEKGWIKCEGGKFTCSRNARIEDGIVKQRRFAVIPWHVVKEFLNI